MIQNLRGDRKGILVGIGIMMNMINLNMYQEQYRAKYSPKN